MRYLGCILVMAIIIFSCQTTELESPIVNNPDYTAEIEAFVPQTKTYLDSKNKVIWLSGDRISIFHGSPYADEFELIEDNAGSCTGAFKSVSNDNVEENVAFPCNVAFYPYKDRLRSVSARLESADHSRAWGAYGKLLLSHRK